MKRILMLLLSVCLLVSLLPAAAMATEPDALFAGGSGTEADPYLIHSPQALDGIRQFPKAHYRQIADIDLSGWGSWQPITNFRGSYDGGGCTIANLSISATPGRQDGMYFGLFGFALNNGTFRNITLTNVSILVDGTYVDFYGLMLQGYDGPVRVGGVCADAGHFENCSVSGSIQVLNCAEVYVGGIVATRAYDLRRCTNSASIYTSSTQRCDMYDFHPAGCGGITGWFYNSGTVEGCSNLGSVQLEARGEGHLGGIVGKQQGAVEDCANFGYILCTGSGHAGGIAGTVCNNLRRCVNYGDVSADVLRDAEPIHAGGIAGFVENSTAGGSLQNCYNLARQIVCQKTVGGTTTLPCGRICGSIQEDTSTPYNCGSFFDTRLNGVLCEASGNAHGTDLTADDLLRQETYEGFDFSTLWSISFEHGGAVLNAASPTPPEEPVTEITPFCELTYRADYLTSGNMNILSDPALYNSLISCNASPSRCIVNAHGEDMRTAASAWNAIVKTLDTLTGNPDYAITHNLQQHDLLVAYILDAVGTQTEHRVADSFKNITKEASDLTEILADMIKNYEGKNQLFSDYMSDNMADFMEKLGGFYEKHNSGVAVFLKSAEGMKAVANIAKGCSNFTELMDNLVGFVNLYHASDSTKQVLRTMYRLCPKENKNLHAALGTICDIMDAATEELFEEMLGGKLVMSLSVNSGIFVTKKLFDYAAKELAAGFPVAGAALAICKTQAYAVDKLFGVDKTVEQYFKMCALMELDQLAGLAVNQSIIDYKDDPTAENAQVLLSAIDLKRSLMDRDFTEAIKYSEIIQDEGILRKANDNLGTSGKDLNEKLLKLRAAADTMYHSLDSAWLIPLATDYPEIAKAYDHSGFDGFWEYMVTFHCPVEIGLFDSKGNRVAIILEGIITTFQPIGAVYYDGSKTLMLPSGDYRVQCHGYEQGEMDVQITVHTGDVYADRTLYFNRLPVSQGGTYQLTFDAGTPVLADPDGNILPADHDSMDSAAPRYEISLENGLILGEIAASTAKIAAGQPLQITALVPEGCRFTGWRVKKGNVELLDPKSPSTSFTMTEEDVLIKASYQKITDPHESDDDSGFQIPWLGMICGGALVIALLVLLGKKKKTSR